LITNKARFIYDAFNVQRLLHPQIRVNNVLYLVHSRAVQFMNVSWTYAIDIIVNK